METQVELRQPNETNLGEREGGQGQKFWKGRRNDAAFWILGLLNNSAYVVMIAGANEISSGAIGLTYLCAVFPALIVKTTGPYWFHLLSYRTRSIMVAVLMSSSYITVAYGHDMPSQLFGVVLGSLQGGMGEAMCLAMSAFYDSRSVITFWSSGTGFAGVFGYAWVAILHVFLALPFQQTLLLANIGSLAWIACYFFLLESPESRRKVTVTLDGGPNSNSTAEEYELGSSAQDISVSCNMSERNSTEPNEGANLLQGQSENSEGQKFSKTKHMTLNERWIRTSALWPYLVPLILVYFAEYSMQAGAWTSMGFPVTDKDKRVQFYTYSNWCYQAGVFLSRSSGLLFQATIKVLWAMPVAQLGFLAFFSLDAYSHFWQDYWLLLLCLCTGLLGGAVYVNAFTLISRDVDPAYKEFSLSAASVGDSLGIACADVFGIILQGCLFRANHIPGASFSCGA